MKANELMVGDWVMVTSNPPEPMKIEYIDNGGWLAHLQPIPITEDILEKNGWDVEDACYAKYNLPDTYSSLEFYFYESRLRKWWKGVDEWDNHNEVRDITFQCHCSYIHELQHALRLSGLNDIADNFKI